jgi:intergrase/recombinase
MDNSDSRQYFAAKQKSAKDSEWYTLSSRIKKSKLAIVNLKLKQNGFKTFGEFVNTWIDGKYPAYQKDEQVEKILNRIREKGITDPLTGEFNPTFYRTFDSEEMLTYLLPKYIYKKHAKDLVRYCERYIEIFFTKPQLIQAESGHKRAWICDAMRKLGMYYDRKMHNPELKILIEEIIKRYELNKKMRIHDRVWLVDGGYIDTMVRKVLEIDGDIGIIVKFAFFSGLRGEEMTYTHETAICDSLKGCNCDRLHITHKMNDVSIIVLNRIVGQKHSYFTIVPTLLWNEFRGLDRVTKAERNIAHMLIKSHTGGKATLMDLRKFHYNVLCRTEMGEVGAEVLAGRAKSISAKHYLIHELDKMSEQYSKCMLETLNDSQSLLLTRHKRNNYKGIAPVLESLLIE